MFLLQLRHKRGHTLTRMNTGAHDFVPTILILLLIYIYIEVFIYVCVISFFRLDLSFQALVCALWIFSSNRGQKLRKPVFMRYTWCPDDSPIL